MKAQHLQKKAMFHLSILLGKNLLRPSLRGPSATQAKFLFFQISAILGLCSVVCNCPNSIPKPQNPFNPRGHKPCVKAKVAPCCLFLFSKNQLWPKSGQHFETLTLAKVCFFFFVSDSEEDLDDFPVEKTTEWPNFWLEHAAQSRQINGQQKVGFHHFLMDQRPGSSGKSLVGFHSG